MEVLRVENVSKRYGTGSAAFQALSDVSLRVATGEFLSITGPSGSGKSTLLNLLAGLDAPGTGRVLLKGRDLAAMKDREISSLRLREIGFVFQSFNLFPALTAAENVAWPLEFSGVRRARIRERVAEVLTRVGMTACAGRRPSELSGGEQQRVAMARALVNEPSIILADEPTGNLDSTTGDAILSLLRDLNAASHVTIVMVTHRGDADPIGSRTVALRDGRIVRDSGGAHTCSAA
jgi:putative ABC transport system ATP-binding protein